jgi:hypothetical protein
LTYDDLKEIPAWVAVGDYAQVEDAELEPVEFDEDGTVPARIGEVWCLCNAVFADGSEHLASAMCRGDSSDGPLLWTVWNGTEDVPLFLPPAPPPVLAKRGPEAFSAKFNADMHAVFPLKITAVARFAVSPEERSVRVDVAGVL